MHQVFQLLNQIHSILLTADDNSAEAPVRINTISPSSRPGTIERVFTGCMMDLKQIPVLDGIEILPDSFPRY
jgi:hypothetical protein